jgi:ferredoxin
MVTYVNARWPLVALLLATPACSTTNSANDCAGMGNCVLHAFTVFDYTPDAGAAPVVSGVGCAGSPPPVARACSDPQCVEFDVSPTGTGECVVTFAGAEGSVTVQVLDSTGCCPGLYAIPGVTVIGRDGG